MTDLMKFVLKMLALILATILIGLTIREASALSVHPESCGWVFDKPAKVYINNERVKNWCYDGSIFWLYDTIVKEKHEYWIVTYELMAVLILEYQYGIENISPNMQC